MTGGVLTSRRWQLAFWGTNVSGAFIFWMCASDLSWVQYVGAYVGVYVTGFLVAVLVEIGTQ